ncbi:hypothetical protein [Algoriphagus alkaliphilus]|nr:hypothetical protein [Algoriphagus alkaliphilus]
MKTYLQLILDCFAAMDIEGLRLYLKEEHEYQNASKEVFLNKIEGIFEELQKSGDSSLMVFPGACCNSECNPELARTGYRFIGDVSRNFFDLRFIIEPKDNDQVIDITEIFKCNYFLTNEDTGELGEHYEVFIFKDEEIDFPKTPEYLIHVNKAIRAQSELASMSNKSSGWEEAVNWLLRHKSTYEYICENDDFTEVLSWTKFKFNYQDLGEVIEVFQMLAQFEILEFSRLNREENEEKLMSGILKIEEILNHSLLFFHRKIEIDESGYYWNFGSEFNLRGGLISEVGKWMDDWFYPTQKMLVEKYFALTEAELDRIVEFNEVPEFERRFDILTTHIDIRKKALENGEWIPFYLGSKAQIQS